MCASAVSYTSTTYVILMCVSSIHTGLIGSHDNSSASEDTSVGSALNSYVVKYREDMTMRDTVLSTYSPLAILRCVV